MKKSTRGKNAAEKRNKTGRAVVAIILLIMLAVGIFCLVYFSGGTDTIAKVVKYNVQVNGETYYADSDTENNIDLPITGELRFTVKNGGNCYISIVPNTDVTFYVDGTAHHLSDEKDLTYCFNIKTYDSAFAIVGGDYSLYGVLTYLYGDDLTLPADIPESPYKLVVTSGSGESVEFLLTVSKISSIVLSPDSVVF